MEDKQLTKHFRLSEFVRKGDSVPHDVMLNLTELAIYLEKVRSFLGDRPIRITSGYRTIAHHLEIYKQIAKAKGVAFNKKNVPMGSYHLRGKAVDFFVQGMTSDAVRKKLDPWWEFGMELGTPHVHLDTRPEKKRFYP